MILSLAMVCCGFFLAWFLYKKGMRKASTLAANYPAPRRIIFHKFYVDEFYLKYIVGTLKRSASLFARIDLRIIDGLVNLTGRIVEFFSILVRVFQTGVVHSYAFWFILGAVVVLFYVCLSG